MTKEEILKINRELNNMEQEYIRMQQDKDNLIRYLEYKIKEIKKAQMFLYEHANTKLVEKATVNSAIRSYQDILERIKNRNYD